MSAESGVYDASFSVVSTTSDIQTIYTPSLETEQRTDDFEIVAEEDEYLDDEDHLWDQASEASTSATPSVYMYEFKHGRRYHGHKKGRYPLPNDNQELDLEELKHLIMLELMDGHLFLSDIGEAPQKIIDIGTGTGLWAVDVADKYPSASVIGTDLSPIQSSYQPVNLRIFVDDCEGPEWLHGRGFDFAHIRGISATLRRTDTLMNNCHKHMKAGGWMEFQDLIPVPQCDDGTMQDDDPFASFAKLSIQGMQALGCHRFGGEVSKEEVESAGFVNVRVTIKKVPIGAWAQGKKLAYVGMLMKTVLMDSLSAYAAKPFEALGMPVEERKQLMDMASKSLDDKRVHRYLTLRFVYGQKGPDLGSDYDL